MTLYSDLSQLLRGLICLTVFLTVMLFQYCLLRVVRYRQKRTLGVCAAAGSLAAYALLQLLLNGAGRPFGAAWVVSALIVLLAIALQNIYLSYRHGTEHIGAASIKKSVDELPVGICCYWPGGLVKLLNERMEALSYAVTGGVVLNGERLWDALARGEGRGEFLQTGDAPVVRTEDGRVWSFRRENLELDGGTLYELLATELTDEYAANAELLKKRERVGAFNTRLRALNEEIERMTVEKEVLAAKASVHDDLSRALLYAKQYYQNPASGDRETLLRIWGEAIHFARSEGPEHWRDLYAYAAQVGGELGVSIEIDGELPQTGRTRELFADALITCLSNAARHGGADALYVTVRETDGICSLRIANNGAAPGGEIAETGGLMNLRGKIERAGGKMRVETAPEFALTVELKKEENEDAVSGLDRG